MTDQGALIPRNRAIHPEPYDPGYKTSVARSPFLPLLSMESTPSEETGPRFGHTKLGALDNNLILNWTKGAAPAVGERILVHGRLLDEMSRPIPNALIEIWQANAGGRYRHKKDTYFAPLDPNFGGCGRTITDENGGLSLGGLNLLIRCLSFPQLTGFEGFKDALKCKLPNLSVAAKGGGVTAHLPTPLKDLSLGNTLSVESARVE